MSASYRFQLLILALRTEVARKVADDTESSSFSLVVESSPRARAAAHQCDAWIIPHPLLNSALPERSVLLIPLALTLESAAEEQVVDARKARGLARA